nr:hypothetical protein BaRGS_030985 [Batillaria attramentaria]
MSADKIPERPVQALAASLRPVNLTSSHSTPPVFSYFVTDYSSPGNVNGQHQAVVKFPGLLIFGATSPVLTF